MSVIVPSRFKSKLEDFIAELKEFSLLPQNETVIEGFYTLLAEKGLYYGILSQNHLILIQKKYMKFDTSEIIPLKKIKETTFYKARRTRDLVSFLIPIGIIPIIALQFCIRLP